MRGINKVILIGNCDADPEPRATAAGGQVTNVRLATSESWKDKNTGQMQERTEWHRVVLFGKLADVASEYLAKGGKVYLEGRLQTRKWQDKDGRDHFQTEIVGSELQRLDAPRGNGSGTTAASQPAVPFQAPAPVTFDDDIAF